VAYFVSYLVLLVYLVLNMKLAAVYASWQEVPIHTLALVSCLAHPRLCLAAYPFFLVRKKNLVR
jgi:hypothetical protein